jgi:tyrosyl-tRNA synthetase
VIEEYIKAPKTHIILGFQASGKFHLGHYLILKNIIKDKRNNPNLKVTILISDVHAKLNFKQNVETNTLYAKKFMQRLLPFAQICISSDIVKDPLYWGYVQSFVNKISFNDIYRATPLDVKLGGFEDLKSLSGNYFLYSVMQCIDGYYLGGDTIYCGLDQRKIYMLAYDTYTKLGWPKFNLKLFPLVNLEGVETKNHTQKMSKSKSCIRLDSKLVQSAQKELLQGSTYLNYIITESFLQTYTSESKKEFLTQLIKDVQFTTETEFL